jgi:hypothetical protein
MPFKNQQNIYWLFSSTAQAIAAFIGFLAAGFFFAYDRIDKQVQKDETLEEIYEDIKKQYFTRLRILFALTGLSIVLSLVVVYVNGLDVGPFTYPFYVFVGLLNLFTIIWAIYFVVFIVNPQTEVRTAEKLIKQNEIYFVPTAGKSLSRTEFVDKYLKLEKILRELYKPYAKGNDEHYMPMGEIIAALYQRGILADHQADDLRKVTKLRNLAVHGNTQNIEEHIGDLVDELILTLGSNNKTD